MDNRLYQLLAQAVTCPTQRAAFYQALPEATIYYALQPASNHQPALLQINTQQYLPIFSSLAHLQQIFTDGHNYLTSNLRDLIQQNYSASLLLDYGCEYAKSFSRSELQAVLDGSMVTGTYPAANHVLIGQAEQYPEQLVQKLKQCLPQLTQVTRAWVAHYYDPDDQLPPHTLLALETSHEWHTLIEHITPEIEQLAIAHPPLEILRISNGEGIESYFLHECTPFYTGYIAH